MSRFRVASYNVHSCIGIDRQFAPERIVEILQDMDADVVALQELGWHHRGRRHFDQFAYLAESTGYTVLEGATKFHARAHYGNAILARHCVLNHKTLDLSRPLHIPRGCVMAEVAVDGHPVTVVNAHLGLSPWERRRQVSMLAAEIAKLTGEVILMGDFNSWKPASTTFQLLTRHLPHYTDAATFHARAPRVPLDRIYLSAGLAFETTRVWRSRAAVRASDHLPIVADLRRRQPETERAEAPADRAARARETAV